MSQRRVARLIPIERMTLRYEHYRDRQETFASIYANWPAAVFVMATGV